MLISKEVEVQLGSNIKYYEGLGYEIPRYKDRLDRLLVKKGTTITVRIEDVPTASLIIVEVECDYCKDRYTKKYSKYNKHRESVIKKDCCKNCISKKNKEVLMQTHGVTWNTQIPKVIDGIKDKTRLDESIVNDWFNKCDYTKLDEYINYRSPIRFICNKHSEYGVQITSYTIVHTFNGGCKYCRYEKTSGENHYLWQGGVNNLSNHLRNKIHMWKMETLKKYDFKCNITGISDKPLVIHHLVSFTYLVNKTLDSVGLILKPLVTDYTDEELKLIESSFSKIHQKHGLGVIMLESLHNKFHSTVGRLIVDTGEFEEFKRNYNNGLYIDLIEGVS